MRSVSGSVREVREALTADGWRERFPTAYKIAGPKTHRAWTASALGTAVFSVAFWSFALMDRGNFAPVEGEDASQFPGTVAVTYLLLTLVASPLFVHTLGRWLDKWVEPRSHEDSVLIFTGVGVALAAVPVTIVTLSGPGLSGLPAAVFLFGLPIILATALSRAYLPRVMRSQRATDFVFGLAGLPPVVLVLFLLGLYVAQGAGS